MKVFNLPVKLPDVGIESAEFTVLTAEDFVYGGEDISVTEADLDKAVENFNAWMAAGQEVSIDYDHSFVTTGDSKAAGWFTKLYRKGKELFATVKWTDAAREMIEAGEYRYFSPEFHPEWEDQNGIAEGFTVVSGALTNRPFIRGATQVSLSQVNELEDRVSQLEAQDDTPNRMADEDTTTTETEDTTEVEEGTTDEVMVTMSEGEAADLRAAAEESTSLKDRVNELAEKLEAVTTELAGERFAAVFAQAQREGRVDAKEETKEKWSKRFSQFGFAAGKELLDELTPDTIPVNERGASGDAPEVADAPVGVDPERYQLHTMAVKLAKEEDIPYADAAIRLEQERS